MLSKAALLSRKQSQSSTELHGAVLPRQLRGNRTPSKYSFAAEGYRLQHKAAVITAY